LSGTELEENYYQRDPELRKVLGVIALRHGE
jgi:hypothetical protein